MGATSREGGREGSDATHRVAISLAYETPFGGGAETRMESVRTRKDERAWRVTCSREGEWVPVSSLMRAREGRRGTHGEREVRAEEGGFEVDAEVLGCGPGCAVGHGGECEGLGQWGKRRGGVRGGPCQAE